MWNRSVCTHGGNVKHNSNINLCVHIKLLKTNGLCSIHVQLFFPNPSIVFRCFVQHVPDKLTSSICMPFSHHALPLFVCVGIKQVTKTSQQRRQWASSDGQCVSVGDFRQGVKTCAQLTGFYFFLVKQLLRSEFGIGSKDMI